MENYGVPRVCVDKSRVLYAISMEVRVFWVCEPFYIVRVVGHFVGGGEFIIPDMGSPSGKTASSSGYLHGGDK